MDSCNSSIALQFNKQRMCTLAKCLTKVVSANAAASSAGCVGISVVYCASPDAYQYTVYQYVTEQY